MRIEKEDMLYRAVKLRDQFRATEVTGAFTTFNFDDRRLINASFATAQFTIWSQEACCYGLTSWANHLWRVATVLDNSTRVRTADNIALSALLLLTLDGNTYDLELLAYGGVIRTISNQFIRQWEPILGGVRHPVTTKRQAAILNAVWIDFVLIRSVWIEWQTSETTANDLFITTLKCGE